QDWLNSRTPSSSLSLSAGVLAAGCARPASGQDASKKNQHAARHFIGWPRIGTAVRMFSKTSDRLANRMCLFAPAGKADRPPGIVLLHLDHRHPEALAPLGASLEG